MSTVTITQDEFDSFASDFANSHNTAVRYADDVGGKQVVYEFDVPGEEDDIVLRVFSSVNDKDEYKGKSYAGESRATGYGSIKTVLWHKETDKPITGRSHTKRIKTWKKNLRQKMEDLLQDDSYHCDECGEGVLVIRSGPHGKFKGCSEYPECENKINL